MEEVWRDIKGFENKYQVSNLGKVKSLNYFGGSNEQILKQKTNPNGYMYVSLWKNNKESQLRVHRLVAEAFIPNPDNKVQVDHINCNRIDNRVENLRWCTRSENMRNPLTLKKLIGKNAPSARSVLQFSEDGYLVKRWFCMRDAEQVLGIKAQHISRCCRGERKSAGGYVWKYFDIDMYCLGKLRNKLLYART